MKSDDRSIRVPVATRTKVIETIQLYRISEIVLAQIGAIYIEELVDKKDLELDRF